MVPGGPARGRRPATRTGPGDLRGQCLARTAFTSPFRRRLRAGNDPRDIGVLPRRPRRLVFFVAFAVLALRALLALALLPLPFFLTLVYAGVGHGVLSAAPVVRAARGLSGTGR